MYKFKSFTNCFPYEKNFLLIHPPVLCTEKSILFSFSLKRNVYYLCTLITDVCVFFLGRVVLFGWNPYQNNYSTKSHSFFTDNVHLSVVVKHCRFVSSIFFPVPVHFGLQ